MRLCRIGARKRAGGSEVVISRRSRKLVAGGRNVKVLPVQESLVAGVHRSLVLLFNYTEASAL